MAETLKETLEETNAELETVEVVETEEKTNYFSRFRYFKT